MKKTFIPVLALMLLGTSCNILDKEPLTTIAPASFFKTADDAEAGITAVYDALQLTGAYGQDMNVVGEMPSDNCTTTNNDVNAMERIIWTPTTSQVGNVFRDMYAGINRANAVIKYVPTIEMPPARRDQIVGEARFLRALFYFNLVRLYGGVSMHLEPVESNEQQIIAIARSTPEQVYAQIVDDLSQAETAVLTDQAALNRTRVNKQTVNALQAKAFLTMRRWSDAVTAAGKVLSAPVGGLTLAATPKALYPPENKPESIFEVQFAGTADGGFLLPDLVLPAPPASYSFQKFNIPTLFRTGTSAQPTDLTSVVDTLTDLRWKYVGTTNAGRDHVSYVDSKRSGNDRGPFVYKWTSTPVQPFNSADNYYLLRLADVYLMYAEASNEQNGPNADALSRLNSIRTRAGLPTLTLADLGTKQAFRNEVDKQRRLELAFEGERWFDLLRYARHNQAEAGAHAVTALTIIQQQKGTANVNYLLFPIPQSELNNNVNTQQNPGY